MPTAKLVESLSGPKRGLRRGRAERPEEGQFCGGVGYAFAAQKPIVGYVTDARAKASTIAGAVVDATHDVKALAATLSKHLVDERAP